MSTKSATLAKSLHTVSALVAVARLYQSLAAAEGRTMPAAYAVESAVTALGYMGASDPHGLVARAVAILAKDAAPSPDAATRAFYRRLAVVTAHNPPVGG